jgi:hypothetical protein
MKWFDTWILRRAERIMISKKEVDYHNDYSKPSTKNAISSNSTKGHTPATDESLNFKVYNAHGGKIVEFSRYDRRSERVDHELYIINKDQDFGERIAKIATFETLKM